jgi:formylglycine-generating enzyme required for sulfatase activity
VTRAVNELRRQLAKGQVVVVVGAGYSIAATDGAELASWTGLLSDGLEQCSEYGRPPLRDEALLLSQELVSTGTVDMMLAAASIIEARLGAPGGAEWRRWLKESVGNLEVSNPKLGAAIHELGAPILTTNYDSLLHEGIPGPAFQPLTWNQTPQWVEALSNERKGILHLHGWWDEPESVVLGVSSYESILRAEAAQEIQRALGRFNTLLFIGYGAGLSDPNFGPLLEWLQRSDSPNHRHYVLMNTEEIKTLPEDTDLNPIEYGPTYELLPLYLSSLVEDQSSQGTSVARDLISLVPPGSEFSEAESPDVPRMVAIPSGTFEMGSSHDPSDSRPEELPVHTVRLDYSFAVSRYPVTFDEWAEFAEATGARRLSSQDSGWGRGKRPAINVNWYEANEYIEWLSHLASVNGTYRLLSEAEWEYVARGGTNTRYWWGDEIDPSMANYDESGLQETTPVDRYSPNPLRICDLLGNTWEWTQDAFHENYEGAPADGSSWAEGGEKRVVRGGCWYYDREYLEVSARLGIEPSVRFNSIGFRVARTIRQPLDTQHRCALISCSSGLAATRHNDGSISQEVYEGSLNQVWEFDEVSETVFAIREPGGPAVLSVGDPVGRNLSPAVAAADSGLSSQRWHAVPEGDGYLFESLESGKVLDVEGISAKAGTRLIQFARHGNANQRWWAKYMPDS